MWLPSWTSTANCWRPASGPPSRQWRSWCGRPGSSDHAATVAASSSRRACRTTTCSTLPSTPTPAGSSTRSAPGAGASGSRPCRHRRAHRVGHRAVRRCTASGARDHRARGRRAGARAGRRLGDAGRRTRLGRTPSWLRGQGGGRPAADLSLADGSTDSGVTYGAWRGLYVVCPSCAPPPGRPRPIAGVLALRSFAFDRLERVRGRARWRGRDPGHERSMAAVRASQRRSGRLDGPGRRLSGRVRSRRRRWGGRGRGRGGRPTADPPG